MDKCDNCGGPFINNFKVRPVNENFVPERGVWICENCFDDMMGPMEPCEKHGHDLVPNLGFDNVAHGEICRQCSKKFN